MLNRYLSTLNRYILLIYVGWIHTIYVCIANTAKLISQNTKTLIVLKYYSCRCLSTTLLVRVLQIIRNPETHVSTVFLSEY